MQSFHDFKWWSRGVIFLDSHSTTQTLTTRTHTHPYKYTYVNPTPMSTFEGLSTMIWTLVGSVPLDRPTIGLQAQSQPGSNL
jgi:hypothetical protein